MSEENDSQETYRTVREYYEANRNGSVVQSSDECPWQGFDAARMRHSNREIAVALESNHVDLYLGRPSTYAVTFDGRRHKVQQTRGTIEIILADQFFELEFDGRENDDIYMSFTPGFLRGVAAETDVNPDRVELVPRFGVRDPLIEQIGLRFLEELQRECASGRLHTKSLANVLAVHLLRNYSAGTHPVPERAGGLTPRQLQRAVEFINDHLERDVALAELAEAARISPYYFARQFKRSTGLTPHRYVVGRRVEEAKRLLAETRLPIVEVSLRVGFQSQSHFTATFRRIAGVTPREYRRSQ